MIFVGVLVALAADDWRQNRLERAEAESSLRVILADLRRDSAMASATFASVTEHADAARWLFEHRGVEEPPADSLNLAFLALDVFVRPVFSRAGYDGLRAANRLGFVGSDSLRLALAAYYEVDQLRYATYAEIVYGRREEMLRTLAPLIQFSAFPPVPAYVTLTVPWAEFVARPGVFTQLRGYGGSVASMWLQFRALDATLVDLIGRVDAEVGGT